MVPPQGPIFTAKSSILVDGGCASACEELVEPFKESHRGALLGETTEGSTGPAVIP